MPQNKHCNIRFRDVAINSVSGPVDVIVPFDVIADPADGVGDGSAITVIALLELLFL